MRGRWGNKSTIDRWSTIKKILVINDAAKNTSQKLNGWYPTCFSIIRSVKLITLNEIKKNKTNAEEDDLTREAFSNFIEIFKALERLNLIYKNDSWFTYSGDVDKIIQLFENIPQSPYNRHKNKVITLHLNNMTSPFFYYYDLTIVENFKKSRD